jgi:hypothetical protein
MPETEPPVTYRHDDDRNVDVAEYDAQDIASIEAVERGEVLVFFGGARQERSHLAAANLRSGPASAVRSDP